ncbi:MAG: tetraacyldisaccharide 4'-kinase [Desulfamplus sp.]|nr:tetraacyldisaccharide 4'-kinase [Desulfamplus sp.]
MLEQIKNRLIQMSNEDFSVKQPFPFNIIKRFLVVLSAIYGAAISVRLWLYRKKIMTTRKVPCFVISIGNIVAGGSGKTPMAIYVAEMIKSMGFNPVVVSRGYGGFIKGDSCVVAGDGKRLWSDPETVGDEPFMMASRLSFPVVVGKDRFKAATMAFKLFEIKSKCVHANAQIINKQSENLDVVILDDGFQHIRLERDLDIVLMDCSRPFGNGRLLPAGRLRENPDRAMERADIIIFTRYSGDENYKKFIKIHKNSGKVFFTTSHRPFLGNFFFKINHFRADSTTKESDLVTGSKQISSIESRKLSSIGSRTRSVITLDDFKGRRACLFSGIADNLSFRKTVENLGVSVKAHLEFNDHHMYKDGEISMILETYYSSGADMIVTTEKDHARLSVDALDNLKEVDFGVIGVEIDFLDQSEELNNIIKSRISRAIKIKNEK